MYTVNVNTVHAHMHSHTHIHTEGKKIGSRVAFLCASVTSLHDCLMVLY
jgi:hypothetical protein